MVFCGFSCLWCSKQHREQCAVLSGGLNIAGGCDGSDEDLDTMPPLKESASGTELLDYMVLVLSRYSFFSRQERRL